MYNIEEYNSYFLLECDKEDSVIENICSYVDPDAKWRIKYLQEKGDRRSKEWADKWDGRVRLYTKRSVKNLRGDYVFTYRIPIGFLNPVITYLKSFKKEEFDHDNYFIETFLSDEYKLLPVDIKKKVTMRDEHQEKAFTAIRENRCGIIEATTGFGKTILGIATIQYLRLPTLIIANNVTIVNQWCDRIEEYFKLYRNKKGSLNVFTSKKKKKFSDCYNDLSDIKIIVTTSSTLFNIIHNKGKKQVWRNEQIKKWLDAICSVLIYDEVHQAASSISDDVVENIDAYYRYGFSATVMKRSDNKDLKYIGNIGNIIYTALNKHIRNNSQIPLKFIHVSPKKISRNTKYVELYQECITSNFERNNKIIDIVEEAEAEGRRILVLVDKLDHAKILYLMSGYEYTSSKDPDREDKFNRFHKGEISALICTYQLVGVGYDYPLLDTVVLAGSGKSVIKVIQAVGRIMRDNVEGKKSKQIFDFADNCRILREHAITRLSIWNKEMVYDISVKGTYLERYI